MLRLTVGELNRTISNLIQAESSLSFFEVEGEISTLKIYPSGHMYFTLKDATAQVSCVMFRQDMQPTAHKLQNGASVIISGRASLYEKEGRFQVYVKRIELAGTGSIWQEFEALKLLLAEQGYFALERKRPLPPLPRQIAVITSAQASVLRDIVQILRRRFPGFSLQLCSCKVQGATAAVEIARAIELVNAHSEADVIILARGGGSMEDLHCFNQRIVADAIFNSRLPIISAIGHETDFTIADFVADLRAPTPSAAAEMVYPRQNDLFLSLAQQQSKLRGIMSSALQRARESCQFSVRSIRQQVWQKYREATLRFDAATNSKFLLEPKRSWLNKSSQLDLLTARLAQGFTNKLSRLTTLLERSQTHLELVNPQLILSRGYCLIKDEHEQIIHGLSGLKCGSSFSLQSFDGQIKAQSQSELLPLAVSDK